MRKNQSPVESNELFYYALFLKKSKQGIKTPQKEIDLIHRRLKRAREHAQQEINNGKRKNKYRER